MNDMGPSIEAIVEMSDVSKASFNSINTFARAHNITISGLYFYVAIGALNIEKLGPEQVIYSAIKPTQAAKLLNCDSKKIARWCVALAKKGFLTRDWGGAYKVANIHTWYEISKLVNGGAQNGAADPDARPNALALAMSDPAFIAARQTPVQVRDR